MSSPPQFEEKARLFLRTAALAASLGDYDSAISRCYCAMFLMAEAVLLSVGVPAASHRGVITAFSKHFVARGHSTVRSERACGECSSCDYVQITMPCS